MWIELAVTAGLWLIDKFIRNDKKKEEAKKRFYGYVDHWQKNREKSESVSDDVAWLNEKMKQDLEKSKEENKAE